MNENDFNNGMNGQNQPPIQPNVPPVQDAGTAQNSVPPVQGNAQAAENANPYGAQPVTNAPGQQNRAVPFPALLSTTLSATTNL